MLRLVSSLESDPAFQYKIRAKNVVSYADMREFPAQIQSDIEAYFKEDFRVTRGQDDMVMLHALPRTLQVGMCVYV
jgi:hypothetical protein